MSFDMNNAPDFDEKKLIEALRVLDGLDIKSATLKEIDSLLFILFHGFSMTAININPGTNIIRGRVVEQKPQYFDEITYPKKEYVKKFGRANTVGQSLFYCSNAKNAPFFEIGAKAGDLVAISHWRTKSVMTLTHVGFTKDNVQALQSNRQLHEAYEYIDKKGDQLTLNRMVYEYLGKKFSQKIKEGEEYLYKLTFCIANRFLGHPSINGILYPTIAMNGNVDNIVLKTEFVDDNLELLYVELQQITKVEGTIYSVKTIDNAVEINEYGEIIWTGKHLGWNLAPQEKIIAYEEGLVHRMNDEFGDFLRPVPTNQIISEPSAAYQAFLDSFGDTMKYTVDITINTTHEQFVAKCAVNFDFNNNVKLVTIFVPECKYPEQVVNVILSKRDNFFTESKTLEVVMEDKEKQISVKSEDLIFNNDVYIYSDAPVYMDKLDSNQVFGLNVRIMT